MLHYFPYNELRVEQYQILQEIWKTDEPLLISSETGIGKTVITLSSLLTLRENEKIIVYVRTKAQVDVFLRELQEINKHTRSTETPPIIIPLIGKGSLCPKVLERKKITSSVVRQICRLEKCPLRKKSNELPENKLGTLFTTWENDGFNSIKEFIKSFETTEGCPYYLSHRLISRADVIITTYPFLQNSTLFDFMIDKMETSIYSCFVLIDEAHNLARPRSHELSKEKLLQCINKVGDHPLVYELLEYYGSETIQAVEIDPLLIADYEGLINERLEDQWSTTQQELIDPIGFEVLDFVNYTQQHDVICSKETLKVIFSDAFMYLKNVQNAKKLILMSGSFEPVNAFRLLYGLKDSKTTRIFNPSEKRWFQSFIYRPEITSKFNNRSESLYINFSQYIKLLAKTCPKHTIVYCPSYSFMKELDVHLKADFVEPSYSKNFGVIKSITRSDTKKLILAVAGGKLSEGVEFVNSKKESSLGLVIFAGLPFPAPSTETEYLQKEYQKRFGSELTNVFLTRLPIILHLMQGVGRTTRNPDERGALVVLDNRAINFQGELKLRMYKRVDQLENDLRLFFKMEVQ
jgi:DNA excision repair protein ERCC-2